MNQVKDYISTLQELDVVVKFAKETSSNKPDKMAFCLAGCDKE